MPSATEIICQVGLGEYLVGVSHECDYPPFVKELPNVTESLIPKNASSIEIDVAVRKQLLTEKAIYHLDMGVLKELKPDFIITQSLCEVCAVAEDEAGVVEELGQRFLELGGRLEALVGIQGQGAVEHQLSGGKARHRIQQLVLGLSKKPLGFLLALLVV